MPYRYSTDELTATSRPLGWSDGAGGEVWLALRGEGGQSEPALRITALGDDFGGLTLEVLPQLLLAGLEQQTFGAAERAGRLARERGRDRGDLTVQRALGHHPGYQPHLGRFDRAEAAIGQGELLRASAPDQPG